MPRCRLGPGWIAVPCDPVLAPRESIFEPKPPPQIRFPQFQFAKPAKLAGLQLIERRRALG
jgi:hypothetical protein